MDFVPFYQARKAHRETVAAVDCFLPGALNLSHWRGANPPAEITADTSAAIVLKALEKGAVPAQANCCTNNHFDVDGFVGVWSLQNPLLARQNATLLKAMARLGDFRELPEDRSLADEAIKLVAWLNSVEKTRFYAPFGKKSDEEKACVEKYRYFLPAFAEVLRNPESCKDEWQLEADRVQSDLAKLQTQGSFRYYEDIRLLVVRAPEPLHYYAMFGQSAKADIVLSIYPHRRYELEYKYTTWVDAYGRASFPRIAFRPLVSELNQREDSGLSWSGSDVTDTGPILRLGPSIKDKEILFDHPFNRPFFSSSISPGMLERVVVDFYRNSYEKVTPKEIWTWEEIRRINQGL